MSDAVTDTTSEATLGPGDFKGRVDAYERRLILEALEEAGGHRRRAAALLGLLPTTLHEKMKRLGIWTPARPAQSPPDERGAPEEEQDQ
jgi:DNA-binding NtrC family response regulator